MGRIFASQDQSTPVPDFKDKTFGDLVTDAGVSALTWQELALFNFGTDDPREVNRALAETIGCKSIDPADPSKTAFDTTRGPTTTGKVYLPKLWTGADSLAPNKTHTVTLRKRLPPPAVAITTLPRWFLPGSACSVQYGLEGRTARASKLDFEVHVTRYFAESDKGEISPSGTQGSSPDTTHIIQTRNILSIVGETPPDTTQTYAAWKGESEAKAGVLEKKGTTTKHITHACAPYSVMLRFYADGAEADAKLLLAPFYPQWKDNGKTLDEATLVVTWSLSGDNGKLKAGTLIVTDKDDKPVYAIALDAARLGKKKLDLLKDAPYKLDKSLITKAKMPYRVQLQAHSDAAEDKGLAIATMHTAVKGMQYAKAQLVAFNMRPGTTWNTSTGLEGYRGDGDDTTDLKARCGFMKSAIQAAAASTSTAEDVLKIFMAPEFFYRGKQGGYRQDHMHEVVDEMRAETDKFEYADWLFVFGSVIGYIEHGGAPPTKTSPDTYATHGAELRPATLAVTNSAGTQGTLTFAEKVAEHAEKSLAAGTLWLVSDGLIAAQMTAATSTGKKTCDVDLHYLTAGKLTSKAVTVEEMTLMILDADHTGTSSKLRVTGSQCARIPVGVGSPPWWVSQNGKMAIVAKVKNLYPGSDPPRHEYELEMSKNEPAHQKNMPYELYEPTTMEVMNVAYVQKGWPAPEPDDKRLKAAAIYKEYVSQLDFKSDTSGTVTRIMIDPAEETTLGENVAYMKVPTYGSRDQAGANPSEPSARTATPRTWTHDGVEHTVGSEINLTGIGGGSVVTIDDITFGIEVCLDHNTSRLGDYYSTKSRPGEPKVQVQLIPSWGASIGAGAICAVPNGLVFNVDGQIGDSAARVHDEAWSCDNHPAVTGTGATNCTNTAGHTSRAYKCSSCNNFAYYKGAAPTACDKCDGSGTTTVHYNCSACGGWFPGPTPPICPTPLCGSTTFVESLVTPKALQKLGTAIAVSATVDPGLAVNWQDYFKTKKDVIVYVEKPIPAPDTV